MAKQNAIKEEPLEKQLWKAADKFHKNIDAVKAEQVIMVLLTNMHDIG